MTNCGQVLAVTLLGTLAACTALAPFADYQVNESADAGSGRDGTVPVTPTDSGSDPDGQDAADDEALPGADKLEVSFDILNCSDRASDRCHCHPAEEGRDDSAVCTEIPNLSDQGLPLVRPLLTFVVRAASPEAPIASVELALDDDVFHTFEVPGTEGTFDGEIAFDFARESPTGTRLEGPHHFQVIVTTSGPAGETQTVTHELTILGPPCPPGTEECADPQNRRYCPEVGPGLDAGWVTEPCEFGCREGQCRLCEPGTPTCRTRRTLGTCNADGTGWLEDTCPLGCNEIALDCNNCVPGTSDCPSESTAQFCPEDGSGWVAETCEHGCASGECRVCTPGITSCLGERTQATCNDDGTALVETPCGEFGCIYNRCATCAPGTCFCTSDTNFGQCSSYGHPSGGYSCSHRGDPGNPVYCDYSTGACSDGFSWCN